MSKPVILYNNGNGHVKYIMTDHSIFSLGRPTPYNKLITPVKAKKAGTFRSLTRYFMH